MIEPFEGQIFDPACGVCEKSLRIGIVHFCVASK